jgi:hypothetical protein
MTQRAYNKQGGSSVRLHFSPLIPRRKFGARPSKTAIAASTTPHQMNERMIQIPCLT